MRKPIISITIALLFLMITGCFDFDLDIKPNSSREIDGVGDLPLSGDVIFWDVSDHSLKMANVKSMLSAISYGHALSYTRPVWSNDGSKFAAIDLISSIDSSYFAIKIVNVEDGTISNWRIDNSRYIQLNGPLTWSPDGNTIAFIADAYNKIIYLNTQNGDTIHTKLTLEAQSGVTALAWQPNGEKIAVGISYWHNYQHDNDIWMIEPYSIKVKNRISETLNSGTIEYMDWNSEGSKLLYSYTTDDIFIINSDGREHRIIPNIYGHTPCWSKNGEYILYTGVAGTSGTNLIFGIFVTDINGSFERLLLKDAGYCDWY